MNSKDGNARIASNSQCAGRREAVHGRNAAT